MNSEIKKDYLIENNNLILKDIDISVFMHGVMSQTKIIQTYVNEENKAIEAIYTFPLPLEAVLLELEVELNGVIIRGIVSKKSEALEQYEEAITEGDTAIMLEKIEDGLFTLNLGNLLPGQMANVTMVYSQLYQWAEKELRFHMPTVIAPKYGTTSIEAQQLPKSDLLVEYKYQFNMHIIGLLSDSTIVSPSHDITITDSENGDKKEKIITLKQPAYLDRDLVINFELEQANIGSVIVEQDEEGCSAIASFLPKINMPSKRPAKALRILLDCSGSMEGDSIEIAKSALNRALNELEPSDYVSIVRFGSQAEYMTVNENKDDIMIEASSENIAKLKRKIRFIQADLGGTEIFSAIDYALSIPSPNGLSNDVFLLTDGEVWDDESQNINQYTEKLNNLKMRVFTIGIGSAVSTKLVTEMAHKTNGACELLAPNEGMKDKIQRHFKRMLSPKLNNIAINWGEEVQSQINDDYFFSGDTYHVYARLKNKPEGFAVLTAKNEWGESFEQKVSIHEHQTSGYQVISRMVASQQIKRLENEERWRMAVKYQLMDETTAYIMVKENDGEGSELPEVKTISQMMAAGHSGYGSVYEIRESVAFDDSMECSAFLGDSLDYCDADLAYVQQSEESEQDDIEPILMQKIDTLDISDELKELLIEIGVIYIGDLVQIKELELRINPDFTEKMIGELKELLQQLGFSLGTKIDNWALVEVS